ncbi:MAG: hypothetical protein HY720_04865 [Planctomycetes bacterium]|nr:hypothetical protein [Planctomycetota bacterium]
MRELPAAFAHVFARATAPRPEGRYPGVAPLLADLAAARVEAVRDLALEERRCLSVLFLARGLELDTEDRSEEALRHYHLARRLEGSGTWPALQGRRARVGLLRAFLVALALVAIAAGAFWAFRHLSREREEVPPRTSPPR